MALFVPEVTFFWPGSDSLQDAASLSVFSTVVSFPLALGEKKKQSYLVHAQSAK